MRNVVHRLVAHSAWAVVCAVAALACGPLAAAEPLPVALVNLERLLKEYQPLQDQLEPLKGEAKDFDEKVQLRQAELETVVARLRGTQPGSPDFQRLEQQAVKLQNELRQFVETERQALQKKEADIYLDFYRQMEAAVGKYAKQHGIRLVLRQQGGSPGEEQPLAEVLKLLNRDVIWHEGLDITDEVLKSLQSGAEPNER
jgi:Skp family chaperone for outer membrane proteins